MYYNHYCPPMYDGTCPSCGRCNHCGRGGYFYPHRVYCQQTLGGVRSDSVTTNEHIPDVMSQIAANTQRQVPNVLDALINQAAKQ